MLLAGESPPVFSSIRTGRVATGAAAAISSTEVGASLIRLTALASNTAAVYIGHSAATATAAAGIPLEAGESRFFFVDSLAKLFAYSAVAQGLAWEVYR